MGWLPTPPIVRMAGACEPAVVLSSGVLSAADHELEDGWFALGQAKAVSLAVVPQSVPWLRLKELLGEDVELVIRRYRRDCP